MILRLLAVLAFLILSVLPAAAVQPDEVLADPALEQRARDLSAKLRCLVCQNQSIDDSDAPLARDLRILLRERLSEGYSDSQVIDYLVGRYGEFILLKPKVGLHTMFLWLGPFALLLIGIFVIARMRRSTSPASVEAPLSETEAKRLRELVGKDM